MAIEKEEIPQTEYSAVKTEYRITIQRFSHYEIKKQCRRVTGQEVRATDNHGKECSPIAIDVQELVWERERKMDDDTIYRQETGSIDLPAVIAAINGLTKP